MDAALDLTKIPSEYREHFKFVARCHTDFPFYASHCLKIRDKNGALEPLKLNRAQSYVHQRLEKQRNRTGKVRALVLKGRQQGISTYIQARFYWKVSQNEGKKAYILTHEAKASKNLYDIAFRYHTNCPPQMRPDTGEHRRELVFPKLDSSYSVGTAGASETGRSSTFNLFHGSEVAFWDRDQDHAAASLQAVGNMPETEIILESTANGPGNYFHKRWLEIIDAAGRGDESEDWIAIFVPWFWQDEYRLTVSDDFKPISSKDPQADIYGDEEALIEVYGLDMDQVAWRRKKIRELDGPEIAGLEKFKQEYPCSWEEAFRYSGNKVFTTSILDRVAREVKDPVTRGYLVQSGAEIRFVRDPRGWLEVFQQPHPAKRYVMGLDVSEGLPHGDITSGHVLTRGTVAEQVARVVPYVDSDEAGRVAVLTCLWYGAKVWLGIERNNMGIAAVNSAKAASYKYLYAMRQEEVRTSSQAVALRPGWETTIVTRPDMLATFIQACREGSLVIRSRQTLVQMDSFIRDSHGRLVAAAGCRDDDIFGLSIALQMLRRTIAPSEDATPGASRLPRGTGSWMY